jgi:hypothetical protein
MYTRTFFIGGILVSLALMVNTFGLYHTFAQVMQSGSYQIQSDSVNFGGGYSSSTSYVSESTLGEVGSGESSSASYALKAGYQQMQTVYLALASVGDVVMSPSISGVTGGTANGSTTMRVITDSPAGYSLSVQASTNPAMQSISSTIANYVPVGNPDYSFVFGVNDALFGFSPEGEDIVTRYKDNGALCNIGVLSGAGTCWDTLATTSQIIASGADANHPLGEETVLLFRVGVGANVAQAPGVYTATTTVTALPL